MKTYRFKIMSLKTAAVTGELFFGAVDEKEALEHALYTARLSNGYACVGPTGRCIYPKGPYADVVWVLPKEKTHGPGRQLGRAASDRRANVARLPSE